MVKNLKNSLIIGLCFSFLCKEIVGAYPMCDNYHFFCDRKCIVKSYVCDKELDCDDETDEMNCDVEDADYSIVVHSKPVAPCLNQFSCDKNGNQCVLLEQQCNGKKECSSGLDELNCENFITSDVYIGETRRKGIEWLKKQRSGDLWWKENTHRAIVALELVGNINFQHTNNEIDLMAKQLELQMSTFLLRHKTQEIISITQLSIFINALLVTCHDPRHFYGLDLVHDLNEYMEKTKGYKPPLPYLALCNANETIPKEAVDKLLQMAETSTLNLGFVMEIQATAILALTCIVKEEKYANLKQNVSAALDQLKKEQLEDGSFGNVYTTALIIQALIANGQINEAGWNLRAGIDFLKKAQKSDGSFGDVLTTYFILPIFNAKSLVDIKNINCTGSPRIPKGKTLIDFKNKGENQVYANFAVVVGDNKDQTHPITLRIPENSTVLELMMLAESVDSKYKYKTHKIKGENYIYEILNIPNDPEENKFWIIYKETENELKKETIQSPDKVFVQPNERIIMWYKTFDFPLEDNSSFSTDGSGEDWEPETSTVHTITIL